MKGTYKRLLTWLLGLTTVLTTALTTACSSEATDNDEPLPEGKGRIRVSICSPEIRGTRAVNVDPWEEPDHEWEKLQTFRILICDADKKVVQIISGDKSLMTTVTGATSTYKEATVTSEPLSAGNYYIFATANYDDGYVIGSTVDADRTVKFANGYSESRIAMTGFLPSPITVNIGEETNAGTITVWRVLAKLQFEFSNQSTEKIQVIGIEVAPINQASAKGPGIYLFSKDNLESTENLAPGATPPTGKEGITLPPTPSGEGMKSAREDVGEVRFEPASPLELAAGEAYDATNNPTKKIFFYVNETDGTFTTTKNQLSLRFKIRRWNAVENKWYDDELRYGVTTHHDLTDDGTYGGSNGGFNVIRRNDWIHIPVVLTDWQLRIEPIAFVPIAGYPAKTVSSDGLTATFSTGGMIALCPFVKKFTDATWGDFADADMTNVSVTWKNSDGADRSGEDKVIKTPFVYDEVTHYIIGELNQDRVGSNIMTTITVNVMLGTYPYSFTFNVVLQ